jgi:signal transduction histidine kinase/CheY-like chemotaxis protein
MQMKYLLLFLLGLPIFLFGQSKTEQKEDSVSYYMRQSQFHLSNSNFLKSLNFSQKAIKYAQVNKSPNGLANSYSNLGIIYMSLDKYSYAIQEFQKVAFVYKNSAISSQQALNFFNIAFCNNKIKNYKEAQIFLDKASQVYSDLEIAGVSNMLALQQAIIFTNSSQETKARNLFTKIVTNSNEKNIENLKAKAYFLLGEMELAAHKYPLATAYFQKSLKISKEVKNIKIKAQNFRALSAAYDKTLETKKSFFYLKEYLKIHDSLSNLKIEKLNNNAFVSFRNTEQLMLIAQINDENKAKTKANNNAILISILALALISILSLLSLALYKNNNIRNQSNALLKETNNELFIAKENAERASKARSEFLSTVSHELRTPLNAINGITHLLLEENPKKSQIDYLTSLKFSGNYLITFINDILEINRIESANIPIENRNFNLKVLLVNIQNSLKELADENSNTFLLEFDNKIPINLFGDTTKMSQIFMNLLNNSLKFTKSGYVKVDARLESIENSSAKIEFKVSDNGIGIPEDKQDDIFESFSQGSIEINRKYGGTGLGLTIVKRLIELLGGRIFLNSKVGLGTTFTFSLLFEVYEGELATVIEPKFEEKSVENKSILLVEDNKINQMITKKMLENKGMKCQIIENGEDAIIALSGEHKFDLVLMDVHLPGINGTIATERIRKFNAKIPIIALTAISLNENREMLLSYGMTDVITKPFDPKYFYRIIAANLT